MIIIFCGVPGSGKSTIAKILSKKLGELGSAKLFISDKISSRVYKRIFELVKQYKNKVDYLIFDATFYQKKWREAVYQLAAKTKTITIYTRASLETCLKRNRKRKPSLPEKVVHIIYHSFEKPRGPEISIDTEKVKPNQAVKLILKKVV